VNSGARPQLGASALVWKAKETKFGGSKNRDGGLGQWGQGRYRYQGQQAGGSDRCGIGYEMGSRRTGLTRDKASCQQWLPVVARVDKAEQGKRRRRKQEIKEGDGRRKWRCSRGSHEWEATRYQELVDWQGRRPEVLRWSWDLRGQLAVPVGSCQARWAMAVSGHWALGMGTVSDRCWEMTDPTACYEQRLRTRCEVISTRQGQCSGKRPVVSYCNIPRQAQRTLQSESRIYPLFRHSMAG
jgi:hypothetical protein